MLNKILCWLGFHQPWFYDRSFGVFAPKPNFWDGRAICRRCGKNLE